MFENPDCKLCKRIRYRTKVTLEWASVTSAMKWTSVLLVSSFLQLHRKSEVMRVCCYCLNRRKWALARRGEEFLGSQLTKKGKEARSNRTHASPFLLLSGWVNIFSHWPASCCRWFRETKAWLIKGSKMITWPNYYLVILINPTTGSDKNLHVFLQSNRIYIITNLSTKYWRIYSKSKWKEKKIRNLINGAISSGDC